MNLEEVAKRAKVSTAAVSRVLNNSEVVKGVGRVLFNQVLPASWRLLRCDRTETAILSATGADPLFSPTQLATLNTIYTVRGQATSHLHKALAELREIQTEHQPLCRQAIKRERGLDASNARRELGNKRKNEPTMAEMDRQFDDLCNRLYGPNGLMTKGKPAATAGKTNPIAATAAA